MHLYDELNEIPVPVYAHPDGYRVYINYPVGNGQTKKLYIGQYARKAEGTFYANENFRLYCPEEWAAAYEKENAPHYQYNVGMYAMTLALSHRTGLYDVIHDAFGPLYGNALMDFAMYSVMERSNVAYRFKPAMEHEVIFSKDRKDDDWLGQLFGSFITGDMIQQFRIRWLRECAGRGIRKVWISIDGSNNDCDCRSSELPCKAENKSGTNKNVVSYMYAVSAEDGRPVSFFTYYGDEVDSKAFIRMCEFLKSSGMEIQGIILDRGFLTHSVLDLAKKHDLPYVVMLKGDTYSHTHMVIDHGEDIYWNVEHLVGEDGLFGISDGPRKVFKDHEDMAYINLYFDAKNGSGRKITFINKLYKAIREARAMADEGIEPVVKSGMESYLRIEKTSGPDAGGTEHGGSVSSGKEPAFRIVPTDLCNKMLYKKGFESIASSADLGPEEVNRIYHLRDASEKQYMICKSMEGSSVFRVHTTEGICSKGLACFIASVLRREISLACEEAGLKPSVMLAQIERPALALMGNGTYKFINNLKEPLSKLFASVGYTASEFETIAGDVNEREKARGKGVSQYHRTPEEIRTAHRKLKESLKKGSRSEEATEQPAEDDGEIHPARHPGRPRGSKNKKTLAREAAQKLHNGGQQEPKRKPGRPPGSKNKKTLEKESSGITQQQKRKPGRPEGSKDSSPRRRRTKKELQEALKDKG